MFDIIRSYECNVVFSVPGMKKDCRLICGWHAIACVLVCLLGENMVEPTRSRTGSVAHEICRMKYISDCSLYACGGIRFIPTDNLSIFLP